MADISQTEFYRNPSHGNRITEDKRILTERLLHLAVQLLCVQTEENYVIMKKYGNLTNHCKHPRSLDKKSGFQSSFIEPLPPSRISEHNRILEATNKIIELLTGEIPIRCQDVTVYFSMEEWEYLEGHKDLYKDVFMKNPQPFGSIGCFKSHPKISFERISETRKLGNRRSEAVLNVTKELIDLLTGENYILVRTSGMVSEKQSSGQDPIIKSLPHPKLPDDRYKKILEAINKVLKLLSGEVSIRCQYSTVHFSMEEWEYLQGHEEHYKDVVTESQQPLISLDEGLPAYYHDGYSYTSCHLEDRNKNTVTNGTVGGGGNQGFVNCENLIDRPDESVPAIPINTTFSVSNNTAHLDKRKKFLCTQCGRSYSSKYTLKTHSRLHTQIGLYSCTECGKLIAAKHHFEIHLRTHNKPFACSQCSKCFANESSLNSHLLTHMPVTLSKSLSYKCPTCRQDFTVRQEWEDHMKCHPELNEHYCIECGKFFFYKGNLIAHYRMHTGEKPFPCLECGKTFAHKSHLASHQRYHTGEGVTCKYCQMFFVDRIRLVEHERTHTGEKPFVCPECGRGFNRKSILRNHLATHTGVQPFKCTDCGKCFTDKTAYRRHGRTRRCKGHILEA